ncbi:glycosyltransferase family 39 protein [Sciscionella sediminilitoris]|uniref:glycosyltransferase family 39 protein n=1 Tax=Sciscionella sediminilitoris TaxID=1445613 RepID=UPI0004DED6C0|nr:glycosyltransferase family 39 protein [Sciscionella sp. SE31]
MGEASGRAPVAKLGIGLVALATAGLLLAVIERYGFFGDELYFLAAGRRLDVSYADQGPLVPAIARLMDLIAPGSLFAVRLPSVLASAGIVLLAGLLAREFGGTRGAQTLSALAAASSLFLLSQGHLLATATIDSVLWVLITWLLVRWVRTRVDWLLFAAGCVTALDMQVKWLIPAFWICVALAVLVCGPRRMLINPMLLTGAFLVGVSMVPSLVWQAGHGWPQLAMSEIIGADEAAARGPLLFTPEALKLAGVLGVPLLCYGVWRLFRAERLRPYRFLAPAAILLFVFFVIASGRPYYVVGMFPVLAAAGSAELLRDKVYPLGRWAIGVLAVVAVWSSVVLLPWRPAAEIEPVHGPEDAAEKLTLNGQFGWQDLMNSTANAYHRLTPEERKSAVLVTDSYTRAAAFDEFGAQHGLPAVYSPGRGFGYFGPPPDSAKTVLYIGGTEPALRAACNRVEPLGKSESRLGLPGETTDVPIWRCAELREPWSKLWPDLMTL